MQDPISDDRIGRAVGGDRDMLEERARFMLDMGRDDELVVFLPTPPVR